MRTRFLLCVWLLTALSSFGANPSYTVFRGSGGISIVSNPPTGLIVFDGSGIFTSSGTNATIAISTNGVLVMVAATNVNFVMGTNMLLTVTNIGSTAHVGIHSVINPGDIGDALNVFLLTDILPVLVVDNATITNLGSSPPISSVQYNSNGITRGSARFVFTNGPGPKVGIGTGIPAAGATLDVTGHIYAADAIVTNIVVAGQGVEVTIGSFVLNGGTTALVAWNGLGRIRWDADGVMRLENDAANNFNRVNFRDNTAASPALGVTNGDFIVMGGNGVFKLGGSTNKLIAPAVHIANDGVGTTLLRLENPLNDMKWDVTINSHPETYFLGLGRVNDATYAMVWEIGGNVGIGITNPTTRLDVQGRTMLRSNVYFPNISSNALPVALLATDSQGEVYETAVPTVSASPETNAVLTNLIGTVARNVTNVVSLSTTNATSKPLTNAYANGVLTLFGVEAGANVTITPNGSNLVIAATASGGGASTNEVLTNLVGTVARNVTNFVSLSTSNATSKPLTNSYTAGVVTVFGVEAGANITLTHNASNIVIAGASSAFAAGNSNQIPFINPAQTGYTYAGYLSQTNPGFGFSPSGPHGGYGGLMVFGNTPMGLVTIGHPNAGSDFETFATALVVSNRYNGAADFKNDMVKVDAVMIGGGLRSDSTLTRWRVWQGTTSSNDVAEINLAGQIKLYGGTLYRSNTVALPTAAQLGPGGSWVGVSNNAAGSKLVAMWSDDGVTASIKVLAP